MVDLNERRGQEINAAIRFIDEQIKTEDTKRILHMSDAALNDAKQALVDLEAKHSELGLNRAGVESKFYSEGTGIASAQQAKLIAAQVAQAESAAELNQASAMKARAEAWQTANYAWQGRVC